MFSPNNKKLLLVMDWEPPDDWPFLTPLQRFFDVEILHVSAPKNINSAFEKVTRLWKSYAVASIRAVSRLKQNHAVYSWHAVIGLFLAFWCRLLRISSPSIVLAQLILPERPKTVSQKLRRWFVTFSLKRVDVVVVYSQIEVEKYESLYGNAKTHFVFVPLGIDFPQNIVTREKEYIFSGGRSNRDYSTLIQAAHAIKTPVVIVAQKYNIPKIELPPHVQLQYGVFGDEFDKLLAHASVVVIPLDRPDESSGQLVLLRAMAMGKAIVVTANRGIDDYITNEAVMVIPPHDSKRLADAVITLLSHSEKRQEMGARAQKVVAQFSTSNQAERIAELLYEYTQPEIAVVSQKYVGHHEA